MKFIFVLIAVFVLPAVAQQPGEDLDTYFPQQLSARDLLIACTSSSLTATGRLRQRYCRGFVSGVEEAVRLQLSRDAAESHSLFCVPAGTTARALADTFIRYASDSDIELDRPSALIVLEALAMAYPC